MGCGNQVFTAIASSVGSFLMGTFTVWPSYTLKYYTAQNTTLLSEPMTDVQKSLLGSLPALGAIIGSMTIGIINNMFGRKKTGMIIVLPFIIAWSFIQMTTSANIILFLRFLGGYSCGAFLVFAPIFVSEVVQDSIRGMLAAAPMTMYTVGVLASYVMGWLLSYHMVIWLNVAISVVCLLLFFIVHESPVYLLNNNREQEALKALAHYRGQDASSKEVLREFSMIKQQILPPVELVALNTDAEKAEEADKLNTELDAVPRQKMSPIKLLFTSPSSRRAFTAVCVTISLQVLMGLIPVQIYASDLFLQAAPNLSSDLCSVMLASVLVGGAMVNLLIADKSGRRILVISSSLMVAVIIATLGMLMQTKIAPAWVSALMILFYCFSFMYGAGTVPYILISEAFVSEVQNLASSIIIVLVWFLNFVIIAIFPYMNMAFGLHGCFYVFALVALSNAVLSHFLVPETKGLSKDEIQEAFLRLRQK